MIVITTQWSGRTRDVGDHQAVERPRDPASESGPRYGDDAKREATSASILGRRRFWIHCGYYLIVNGLLLVVWQVLATTGAQSFWPVFPLVGWGLVLAFHAVTTFRRPSAPVTETEIREVLQQRHRNRG